MTNDQTTVSPDLSVDAKRKLRRLLWQNVPASLQLLRLMSEEGGITSMQGAAHLGCPMQTVRNALGKLVRQKRATVMRPAYRSGYATYSITPKGVAALAASPGEAEPDQAEEDELERMYEATQRESIEINIDRARRRMVPCSVFDLGRCIAAGACAST